MNLTYINHNDLYQFKSSWVNLLRPLTLSGSISPILISSLYIYYMGNQIKLLPLTVLLTAIVFIQMATNIWNDYFDFKAGQDQGKWQKSSQDNAQPFLHDLPRVAIFLTGVSILLGAYLAFLTTVWVIPIGILGILFGFYYSAGSPSLSAIGLGELTGAVFLGLMPTFLAFVIQNTYDWMGIILIGLLYACLISSMILTNNIRDIEKDQAFRKTLPVRLGKKKALYVLFSIISATYLLMLLMVLFNIFPIIAYITFGALYFVFLLYKSLIKTTQPVCMKRISQHHIYFSLLLFIAFGLQFLFQV